jgi:hypothetical protein
MSDMTVALLVSQVKDLVVSSVSDGKLDTSEVLKIAMAVQALASSVVGLSFDEKKGLVVKVVEKALKEHIPSAVLDTAAVKVALQLVPTVIDIATKVLSVEPVKNCLFSCFSVAKTGALPPAVVEVKKVEVAEVGLHILQPVSETVTPVSETVTPDSEPQSAPVVAPAEPVVAPAEPVASAEPVAPADPVALEETAVKTIESDL